MEKKISEAFGHKVYLLGADKEGKWYFLIKPRWDCGWYWGGLYVQTFTCNKTPSLSRDIETHNHFENMFMRGAKSAFDSFKEFFAETPLSDQEIWKLCELAVSFYTARKYSDFIYRGGSHYTYNPVCDIIKNEAEYDRINQKVIPALILEIENLLKP